MITTHSCPRQTDRQTDTQTNGRADGGTSCHLVCHSATCIWDQSSWHRWAATASTACVVQLGAVADWWCSWPMAQHPCVLVFVSETDILNILCDYQFVFCVLDELYVSHHAWCSRWCSKSALYSQGSVNTISRWGGHFSHVCTMSQMYCRLSHGWQCVFCVCVSVNISVHPQ